MSTEMSQATVKSNLTALANAIAELQSLHAALQTDFHSHDHGSSYTTFTTRITTQTNSLIAGTYSSTITTTSVPNPPVPDNILGS